MSPQNADDKKHELLKRCGEDIAFFASFICTRWTTDEMTNEQYPVPDFIDEIYDQWNQGDLLAIVPRNFAKTTYLSKVMVLWELLFQQVHYIALIAKKGLGEAIIGDIRRELEENELIHWLWGILVPIEDRSTFKREKWQQQHLQLTNGTQIQTFSMGQSFRGQRPDEILVDDPQDNEDVVNPIQAEKFYHWLFTTVYNALADHGSMKLYGTIIGNNCALNKLKTEASSRHFTVIEYPAILNFDAKTFSGIPLWPEKWPIDRLKKRLETIGHDPFFQEFMHQPMIINGSPVFDPETYSLTVMPVIDHLGEISLYRPLDNQSLSIGLDLASGNLKGDYLTFTARNYQGQLYAQYRGHCTQDRFAEIVDNFMQKIKQGFLVPENNMALAFLQAAKNYRWYDRIYRKKSFDAVTQKSSDVLGFNTNVKTKPMIITALYKRLRAGWEVSAEEKEEIENYYHDERGGMNAIAPYHDDLIISDALCLQGIEIPSFDQYSKVLTPAVQRHDSFFRD